MSAIDPKHYKRLDPEPIVVIERWGLGFCVGNAVKYLARAGHKDGVDAAEDLAKARWYVERAALPCTDLDALVIGRQLHDDLVGSAIEQAEAARADAEHWQKLAKELGVRVRALEAQLLNAGMVELRDATARTPGVLLAFDMADLGGES